MAIATIGAERQDDIRSHAPQFGNQPGDHFSGNSAIERLIVIVEEREFANAEHGNRRPQFRLANPSELLRARMLPRFAMAVVAPALPAGRGHEKNLDSLGRILGERSADPQGLVIRMRENRHQAELPTG